MLEADEQNLRFCFADPWDIVKYDEHPDYDKIKTLNQTTAVDFAGVHGEILFFIEVKDFRGFRIENKEKFGGNLQATVAIKVRDTIPGIVSAHRMSATPDAWRAMARHLCRTASESPVKAVLFLEEDDTTSKTAKARRGMETKRLKANLRWLTPHAIIVCIDDYAGKLPDLQVTNLKGAAGHGGPAARAKQ